MVLHLAPPPTPRQGGHANQHLLRCLAKAAPKRLVYVSTTGVYGDAGGARFDETRPVAPATARAAARGCRAAARAVWSAHGGARLDPAHLASMRRTARRRPRDRVRCQQAGAGRGDDVPTNHIHMPTTWLRPACGHSLPGWEPARLACMR